MLDGYTPTKIKLFTGDIGAEVVEIAPRRFPPSIIADIRVSQDKKGTR
jgi:hypothetical protein